MYLPRRVAYCRVRESDACRAATDVQPSCGGVHSAGDGDERLVYKNVGDGRGKPAPAGLQPGGRDDARTDSYPATAIIYNGAVLRAREKKNEQQSIGNGKKRIGDGKSERARGGDRERAKAI